MNDSLPSGFRQVRLKPISDDRGCLTEIYRQEWLGQNQCLQWNLVSSHPGTLRGVHVHTYREDYLIVVEGEMWLGLHDMRRSSPTYGLSSMIRLTPDSNTAAYIPTGIAHGFCFPRQTTTLYGLSDYFSMEDELGCHPDDPALDLNWPITERILSERDTQAGSLAEMQQAFDIKIAHQELQPNA